MLAAEISEQDIRNIMYRNAEILLRQVQGDSMLIKGLTLGGVKG
jgi:hypothetical protein